MAIVEIDELVAYMGGVMLTTDQQAVTTSIIIPGVQQELEMFLNKPVEPVLVRESTLPDCDGFITLKVAPAWRINSVRYSDGNTGPTTSTYYPPALVPDHATTRVVDYSIQGMAALPFRHNIHSLGLSAAYGWGYGTYVVIEYIAGYLGIYDEALKLGILRVCAREVQHMFDDIVGLRSGTVEASQTSDDRRKGWMPEELDRFRRLRRRVIR